MNVHQGWQYQLGIAKLILVISLFFPLSAFAHLISIIAITPFPATVLPLSTTTATFSVTNITSSLTLTVVDQTIFPLGSGLSILPSTCGTPLTPGQSCNINVQLQAPPNPQIITAKIREWASPSADGVIFAFAVAVR